MTKLKELKKSFMEDPEFREEYASVDEEYALIEALVRARTAGRRPGVAFLRNAPPPCRSHRLAAHRGPGEERRLAPSDRQAAPLRRTRPARAPVSSSSRSTTSPLQTVA